MSPSLRLHRPVAEDRCFLDEVQQLITRVCGPDDQVHTITIQAAPFRMLVLTDHGIRLTVEAPRD